MRTLGYLLRKEYKQIFRNPTILRMLFIAPVIQLLVLPWAANYEVKNINVAVTDMDGTTLTRELTEKISASEYFNLVDYNHSYKKSLEEVEKDRVDVILEFPNKLERNLVHEKKGQLFVAINAINGSKASIGGFYLMQVINNFNKEIQIKYNPNIIKASQPLEISTTGKYNPHLDYKLFMVPGILVILLTLIGSNLAANNIVREKEMGTIEQINVTPIKKYQFILGKLIPFWTLALVALTFGLTIAWVIYGIVPVGSYATIYVFAMVYMFAILGFGLLLSTLSDTQQQSMLLSFFFMMIFIMMSGLYTPIDSMPTWAQWITKFNPVSYFVTVMRAVVMKGSSLYDIRVNLYYMILFAIVLNALAVWNYRKRV